MEIHRIMLIKKLQIVIHSSNKYNNSYNNSSSSSYSNEGSDEDISFELSEEDLANLKNGLGLTVNGQKVDITGFDEKFREEVKAAGFE